MNDDQYSILEPSEVKGEIPSYLPRYMQSPNYQNVRNTLKKHKRLSLPQLSQILKIPPRTIRDQTMNLRVNNEITIEKCSCGSAVPIYVWIGENGSSGNTKQTKKKR